VRYTASGEGTIPPSPQTAILGVVVHSLPRTFFNADISSPPHSFKNFI